MRLRVYSKNLPMEFTQVNHPSALFRNSFAKSGSVEAICEQVNKKQMTIPELRVGLHSGPHSIYSKIRPMHRKFKYI